MNDGSIRFSASVARVKTMADGGYRAEFDLPETALDAVTKLMEAKQRGAVLEVAIIPIIPEKQRANSNDKIPTRSEWQS